MAERAELVGGRLHVASRSGRGTAVTAVIPIGPGRAGPPHSPGQAGPGRPA
jgi:hypothetical protein